MLKQYWSQRPKVGDVSIVGAQVSGILNLHTRSVTCFVEKAMTWDTPSACVLLGAYVRKRAVVILHVVSQVEKEKYLMKI